MTAETLTIPAAPARILVKVDEENIASTWWDALAAAAPALWASLTRGEALVTQEELEFLQSLPGWADGPAHAKHPLLFV